MKNIRAFVEDIVHERNAIIARLAYVQGVDLTNSNYDSFKPNEAIRQQSMEQLTELAMYFEQEYKSLCLPEIYHYCTEKHKFNEHWSGIWKKDALKLLGLDSCSDIDYLFEGE
jgi:hypothetical protein